jgi:hypothetical protein
MMLTLQRTVIKGREAERAVHKQAEQLTLLQMDNQRLSNLLAEAQESSLTADQFTELLRLRGEVGRLRQQEQEHAKLRELRASLTAHQITAGIAELNTNTWPRASWSFAGYATPEAAWQSALWSASQGDMTTFQASITGRAQEEVQTKAKDKSEQEIAQEIQSEIDRMKSFQVLEREVVAVDLVVLTINLDGDSHNETRKMTMQKVGEEWKFAGD